MLTSAFRQPVRAFAATAPFSTARRRPSVVGALREGRMYELPSGPACTAGSPTGRRRLRASSEQPRWAVISRERERGSQWLMVGHGAHGWGFFSFPRHVRKLSAAVSSPPSGLPSLDLDAPGRPAQTCGGSISSCIHPLPPAFLQLGLPWLCLLHGHHAASPKAPWPAHALPHSKAGPAYIKPRTSPYCEISEGILPHPPPL